jgi:hypothetical protein
MHNKLKILVKYNLLYDLNRNLYAVIMLHQTLKLGCKLLHPLAIFSAFLMISLCNILICMCFIVINALWFLFVCKSAYIQNNS